MKRVFSLRPTGNRAISVQSGGSRLLVMWACGITAVLVGLTQFDGVAAVYGQTVRFATYNVDLSQRNRGELIKRLSTPDYQEARNVAEVIQRINPDVILLNEFDYDADGEAVQVVLANGTI